MATFYSELVGGVQSSSTVAVSTALSDPRTVTAPGKNHGDWKCKMIHLDFRQNSDLAANDVIRLATFKSHDRLHWMLPYNTAAGWAATALTADLGLYEAGENHDGAVVDQDLFVGVSGVDLTATLNEDQWWGAGALNQHDRGKTLWELAAIGDGSYTEDPNIEFDLAFTVLTSTSVTAQQALTLLIFYSAGY